MTADAGGAPPDPVAAAAPSGRRGAPARVSRPRAHERKADVDRTAPTATLWGGATGPDPRPRAPVVVAFGDPAQARDAIVDRWAAGFAGHDLGLLAPARDPAPGPDPDAFLAVGVFAAGLTAAPHGAGGGR